MDVPSPKTGEIYHPDSVVTQKENSEGRRAGTPEISDLRHTFATSQNGM